MCIAIMIPNEVLLILTPLTLQQRPQIPTKSQLETKNFSDVVFDHQKSQSPCISHILSALPKLT